MKNFRTIDLPKLDLYTDFVNLMNSDKLIWNGNQIGVTTLDIAPDDTNVACGSMNFDWSKAYWVKDEHGFDKQVIPLREHKLTEYDFSTVATPFKGTEFEKIYSSLKSKFTVGRMRIMKSTPNTCLSWHTDTQIRLHYPLKTQDGCFMIIEDEVFKMDVGEWYLTNTLLKHTAFNGSNEERIHLVVNIMDDYNDI